MSATKKAKRAKKKKKKKIRKMDDELEEENLLY